MADWDLLLTDARIATLRGDASDYGVIDDGALAIVDGEIAWIGPASERPGHDARETRSLGNRWITPAPFALGWWDSGASVRGKFQRRLFKCSPPTP